MVKPIISPLLEPLVEHVVRVMVGKYTIDDPAIIEYLRAAVARVLAFLSATKIPIRS